jgi:photosystem II stability/assembly factor-like uncharacterized protein
MSTNELVIHNSYRKYGLLACFAIILVCGALYQTRVVPSNIALLGLAIIFVMSAACILEFFIDGQSAIPFFPAICIFYVIFFGLPVFTIPLIWQDAQSMVMYGRANISSINPGALVFVLGGVTIMAICFYFARYKVFLKIPRLQFSQNVYRTKLNGLFWILLIVHISYDLFLKSLSIPSLGQFVGPAGFVAIGGLYFCWRNKQLSIIERLTLVFVVLPLEVYLRLEEMAMTKLMLIVVFFSFIVLFEKKFKLFAGLVVLGAIIISFYGASTVTRSSFKPGLKRIANSAGFYVELFTEGSKDWTVKFVHFLDDGKVGWVIGETGRIFNTQNGGQNWVPQKSNTTARLHSIQFLEDGKTGWIVGDTGTVLHTQDGGQTWSSQEIASDQSFNAVHFLSDGKTGWVVGGKNGRYKPRSSFIFYTEDAGQTWSRQKLDIVQALKSVMFLKDGKTGWAVGEEGRILHTADGGRNWTSKETNTNTHLYSVQFHSDGKIGWVVGESGTILHTQNGGRNWISQKSDTDVTLNALQFLSDGKTGWAVGDEGTILHTQDGGQSWFLQNNFTDAHFSSVQFSSDGKTGWLVGEDGTIYYTQNGGQLWISRKSSIESSSEKTFPIILSGKLGAIFHRMSHLWLFHVVDAKSPNEVPYWNGKTYRPLFTSFIPRLIYPNKPEERFGYEFGYRYGFIKKSDTHMSINLPWIVELLSNFGRWGVIWGMALVGIFLAFLDRLFNSKGMTELEFIVGMAIIFPLVVPESNLSLMVGSILPLFVSLYVYFAGGMWAINKIPWISKIEA